MIRSVGFDMVDVPRIEGAIRRWKDRFLRKVYTDKEIEYCRGRRTPSASFAARFAAKEAVWKALGLRRGHNPIWSDVEIITDRDGRPVVLLRGKAQEIAARNTVVVSLSHTKEYAAAVAVSLRPE